MLSIAMVCDFFYPSLGGVESHTFMLSQQLIRRGHKVGYQGMVVVLTTAHPPDRTGIRYMTALLKVYYLPLATLQDYASSLPRIILPCFYASIPLVRHVLIREAIDIVHGHASLSSLAHECILHARALGIRTVFTDHSLFSFGAFGAILGNKMVKFVLSDIDRVICVSHTGRENTVLRACLDPRISHVIPNAVIATQFAPDPAQIDPNWITIVVISRLVYRKGIDLLVAAIPSVCAKFPNVRFLIGGDGPKVTDLEQMRERHVLADRVVLLGPLAASDIKRILNKGQIFLNTSLTEAFGIGLLEAAASGLFVVSTKVGGVPEVLPDDMIVYAEPDEHSLFTAIKHAIVRLGKSPHDPLEYHTRIKDLYSWADVAARTEVVYEEAMLTTRPSLVSRFRKYYGCGLWAGKIFVMVIAVHTMIFGILDYLCPRDGIEKALSLSTKHWCSKATRSQEVHSKRLVRTDNDVF